MIRELWNILSGMESIPDDWGEPYFSQANYYDPHPLDKGNFHTYDGALDERSICCVDGGNNKVYESPNRTVHLLRVYFNVFKGKKRVEHVNPLSCFLTSELKGDEIHSEIKLVEGDIPIEKKSYTTSRKDLDDNKLTNVGHTVRKYLEWDAARYAVEEYLDEGDILVRDGVLQTGVEEEKDYADRLYQSVKGSGVYLVGLAKTSSLRTTRGYPLLAAIQYLSRDTGHERWYYNPIADNEHPDHKGDMYVVKYHPDSEYAFRTEFYREQDCPVEDILGHLSFQARDPIFLGYPYGLVEADQRARVTDEEVDYLKGLSLSKMGVLTKYGVRSTDAHDRLSKL